MPQHPFLFLRHGQTDWNVEERKQGHADIPLNATGLEQARAAAQKLSVTPFDLIITSPLIRAQKTAEVVANVTGKPVLLEPLLIERSWGSFEGKTDEELRNLYPHLPRQGSLTLHAPDDAEQWPTILERSRSTIAKWVNAHPDKTLLFVGHGVFLRVLYEALGGPYFRPANATPYRFKPNHPAWDLEELL